ncbi:MAG: hypothetical protein U9Q98_03005, partial [Bacteroidota bacterium]|nr:hypothetical protein [Bacteroidota bacterium]
AIGNGYNPNAIYIKDQTSDLRVGIGTTNPDKALTVNGIVKCKEVEITDNVPSSDYVLKKDYELMTIGELEAFIETHNHLPDVPSAEEFKKNGYKAGDMDDLLLRKIEELILYIIEQDKKIKAIKQKLNENVNQQKQ